jgi:hypothetical protein
MPRRSTRVLRLAAAAVVAGALSFGAHAAFASSGTGSCSESGMIGLTCAPGPTGDSYCDFQCRRDFGPDSGGECVGAPNELGCCRCII